MITEPRIVQEALVSESDLLVRAAKSKGVELMPTTGFSQSLGSYELTRPFRRKLHAYGVSFSKGCMFPETGEKPAERFCLPYPAQNLLQFRVGLRAVRWVMDFGLAEPVLLDGVLCLILPLGTLSELREVWERPEIRLPYRAEVGLWQAMATLDPGAHGFLYEMAAAEGVLHIPWSDFSEAGFIPIDQLFESRFEKRFRELAREEFSPFNPAPYQAEGRPPFVPACYCRDLWQLWDEQLKNRKSP